MRQIKRRLVQILHLQESPRRTALAFSLGVVIAFSPPYGLHTLLAIACAWAFRLNVLALFAGALINNPWTLVPTLALTFWVGSLVTGQPLTGFDWETITVATFYAQIEPYLLSFIVGATLLSLAFGALSYPLAYAVVSRYRVRHPVPAPPAEALPPDGQLR